MVFATNFEPSDKYALTLADAIAKLYSAEITVLHFLNVYDTESEREKKRNDFDNYSYSLQRVFNESNMKFHLLETASVMETLETLNSKFPYDILAMVRRNKTFIERFFIKSFTQNMAYITKKPLIIIPDEE
ncbi:MAG TPA: universal stress protein [Agriterribacter sp.]|nr:universal stress protein [Chitinophagaceae bacterium]HRP33237.1 universal stress protein [Agriterribacter sp.]